MLTFPPALVARIAAVHGDAGRDWLPSAPARIATLARKHGFRLHPPFDGLSYAYVAPVTLADGREAVLKAQPPQDESRAEVAALAALDGRGAVRLLWADADAGFALLERVQPGGTLEALEDDDEATRIIAAVMRQLWIQPPSHPALIPLARWGAAFPRHLAEHPADDPIPRDLIIAAWDTWRDLLATAPAPRLLHGDLHHGNVLRSGDAWLAIDPKGVIGDPAFDVAPLFYNPHPRMAALGDVGPITRRRFEILAGELDLDPRRIAGWAFAGAVLSASWSAEAGALEWPHVIAVAQALRPLAGR